MTAKKSGFDPALKKAINKLLTDTMKDTTASLTDKCKAIDRALKMAAIEAKMESPDFGSGFDDEPE